jgi:hypothetical protein
MPKANAVVQKVMDGAMKRAYTNEYEYCSRVIKALMAVCSDGAVLMKKELEILAVMCVVCRNGGEYMRSDTIIEAMNEMGLSAPQIDTMRNYRNWIKRKGWIRGKELNASLMKAMDEGGICIGIFYKNGRG